MNKSRKLNENKKENYDWFHVQEIDMKEAERKKMK